ncbi:MAG: HEPN domain-containing protein [Bacteroidia bacterium]|nr:HEPN domain-containing protein [Bacteroidia bacterium]
MKKIVNDWLISAESDLILIHEIISRENLTHMSAFHSQQAVEKSFKAIIEELDLGFIRTHSLETLYNKVKDEIAVPINLDMLILLDQLYLDARYPGEMGLLPDGKPSIFEAEEFYNLGKQIFEAARSVCK